MSIFEPFCSPPSSDKPAKLSKWLSGLLGSKFFDPCVKHAGIKKSERNYYCLHCQHSNICQHCLPAHHGHELLQVRRYVYHDVVRVQDVEKHLDCKAIQTYIINGANVVFLNDRPQTKPMKTASRACETCSRSLQDHYRFCSLSCKITALACNKAAAPVGRVLKRKSLVAVRQESDDSVEAPRTPSNLSGDDDGHKPLKRNRNDQEVDQWQGPKRVVAKRQRSSPKPFSKQGTCSTLPLWVRHPSSPSRRKSNVPCRAPAC
jgi:hypothetical protein